MPLTFNLPSEYRRLCAVMSSGARGRSELQHYQRRDGVQGPRAEAPGAQAARAPQEPAVFIVKPTALSRGREIKLARDIAQVDYSLPSIAQQYLTRPALLGGRKCDFRVYVVLLGGGAAPPRGRPRVSALVSREGLCRLCTKPYTTEDLDDVFAHLTNTSINACNESAFRRARMLLSEALAALPGRADALWEEVKAVISVGLSAVLCARDEQRIPPLAQCFELLGADVLLASPGPEAPLRPHLLEFNASPGLAMSCGVDEALKPRVLADALHIVRLHACLGGRAVPFGWFEPLPLLW